MGTQTAYLNSPPVPNRYGARANAMTLMYIALSFGFSLAVSSWVFFRISGGLFNPAVRLASIPTVTIAHVQRLAWMKVFDFQGVLTVNMHRSLSEWY